MIAYIVGPTRVTAVRLDELWLRGGDPHVEEDEWRCTVMIVEEGSGEREGVTVRPARLSSHFIKSLSLTP